MPTSKKRLNICLSKSTAIFLEKLSVRDDVAQATKVVQLLEKALEMEEDEYFAAEGDARASKSHRTVSHDAFWSKVL